MRNLLCKKLSLLIVMTKVGEKFSEADRATDGQFSAYQDFITRMAMVEQEEEREIGEI